jgi:regulator of sigma E protease
MGSNVFQSLGALGGNYTNWIIPFLFTLTVIVFFHELGHFLVARLCGIRVLVFSIGFGPELVGFNDRSGTRWKISAIPLGGYVKFFGDENEASVPDTSTLAAMTADERGQSFPGQPVRARAAVVAAGPIANFILAIVIFAATFMIFGKPVVVDGKPVVLPRIASIQPGSAAASAGFAIRDRVVSIDGSRIDSFGDIQRIVSASAGRGLTFEVDRDGSRTTINAAPIEKDHKWVLGITGDVEIEPVGLVEAVSSGAERTWRIVEMTMVYLGDVVIGRQSAEQIGGVIKIAQISGEVARIGLDAVFNLIAVLSVSIGLLNLFPIPLLDGGHLLFYSIEAIRGRPLSERAQEVGFRIGLAIVVMLMLFATFNDLRSLFPSISGS